MPPLGWCSVGLVWQGVAHAYFLQLPFVLHLPRSVRHFFFRMSMWCSTFREYIVTVALFLVAGFFMALVCLRDEDLCERGFWCRVRVWLRVILKYAVADVLNYAKAPGGPRWMAMARASLVRPSLAWLHVCSRCNRGRHHSSSCERDVGETWAWRHLSLWRLG